MALTKAQQVIWTKARTLGSGGQAVRLSDAACAYLIFVAADDLGLGSVFPECPATIPSFFDRAALDDPPGIDANPRDLFERLVQSTPDADLYFACLASLHKARLKYEKILQTQPIPTLEQVGPRGLLQYGHLSSRALVALLFWRKWFFDIDNRAGQETGYLFEPVIANAIGGTSCPARSSPVRRRSNEGKGRQVDCILDQDAYEFKIRVTIAASGQGRWQEELDFPGDCRASGFTPNLIVLDSTPNPKLDELQTAFSREGGHSYVGEAAWEHLEDLAGETMARFLEKYVRDPINRLLTEAPSALPQLVATVEGQVVRIALGGETLEIIRGDEVADDATGDEIPDDVGQEFTP